MDVRTSDNGVPAPRSPLHDVNNLLGVVLTSAELAIETLTMPDMSAVDRAALAVDLARIKHAAERCASLLRGESG